HREHHRKVQIRPNRKVKFLVNIVWNSLGDLCSKLICRNNHHTQMHTYTHTHTHTHTQTHTNSPKQRHTVHDFLVSTCLSIIPIHKCTHTHTHTYTHTHTR